MKPFNLKEYLANPIRKVVTRNGKDVKIHCTNYNSYQPIVAEIKGTGISESFSENGKFYNYCESSQNDLFFAPEKHEGWVNVYKSENNRSLGAGIWQTEEEAKKWEGAADYVTTIKIEWEE